MDEAPAALDPSTLLDKIGVELSGDMIAQALTHSSYAYEQGGVNNERLEFLGDAVVGQAITAALYNQFPDLPEGELAKRRASIVSTGALAEVAHGIGLGDYLRLGRGEELTGGREKPSLLADALEAVVGAIFVDKGPQAAHDAVHHLMGDLVKRADELRESSDPKTALQEWAAKNGGGAPQYNITDSGPDHQKVFTADVFLVRRDHSSQAVGHGTGSSKKAAELAAAQAALETVRNPSASDA
jgi:ribonuclease III